MAKDTLYIEADEEITTVIDKVISSKDAIVAVVLPKRATVFQSVVNMKLLKKAATEAKKSVVVISSEPAIKSIAAVAGIHLAQSLQSKPSIPKRAKELNSETISATELDAADELVSAVEEIDSDETTKAATALTSASMKSENIDDIEDINHKNDVDDDGTIELDNTSDEETVPAEVKDLSSSKTPKKKGTLKIPDFSSFKLRVGLGVAAVALLVSGWVIGFVILPKATVTLNTDTSSSTVTLDFVATTDVTELDIEKALIPAKSAEVPKQSTATVPATGEKNIGEKATGSVSMSSRICGAISSPDDVPAGTGVSTNGKTYITQKDVSFGSPSISGGCINFSGGSTTIVAVDTGAGSNTKNNSKFEVADRSDVSASGSADGGTDKSVKVVSAADIQKAREQLAGTSTSEATGELQKSLEAQQLQPIIETLFEGTPAETVSASVDSEASEVTVSKNVVFTMLGAAKSDIETLLDAKIKQTLSENADKNIRRNGLDKAVFKRVTTASPTNQSISLQTIAILGPEFDEESIKNEVVGKKRGDIEKLLEAREGVRSVSVDYSPLWITTTPKSSSKIKIVVNESEK